MLNPIILIRSKFENMKNTPTSPYWPTVEQEGTEPQDGNQMIQINNKFIIPGNSITDLVSSVYADLKENYADQDYISQK